MFVFSSSFYYLLTPVILILMLFGYRRWRQDVYSLVYSLVGPGTKNLAGSRIWVVGCSQGIGEQIAYQLAAAKCDLILSARSRDKLVQVAEGCKKVQTSNRINVKEPHVLPFDVTKVEEHKELVRQTLTQIDRIDGVVLCTGRSQRSLIEEMDFEVVQELFHLNTLSIINFAQALLPHFIQNKKGMFCVVGSLSARIPATMQAAYGASKAALQSYFTTLRYETVPYNIKVCINHPGPIYTGGTREVFREKRSLNQPVKPEINQHRMNSRDCARIIATAMGNNMEEVWMSNQPILFLTYLYHYGCGLSIALMTPLINKMSLKRIREYKEGRDFN